MTTPIISTNGNTPWIASTVAMGTEILDRMERAVVKVRERLLRATSTLNQANIPYAVVGGNAVASWVATIDEGAVRNTRDVDLLVRREDFAQVVTALVGTGFVETESFGIVMFRDGAEGKPSEAIHILFAGERAKPDHLCPAPEIETIADPANFRVMQLQSLVLMKLMSNSLKDLVHLQDLISVGLIDQTWPVRFPEELANRLQQLLDIPEG